MDKIMQDLSLGLSTTLVGMLVVFVGLIILIVCIAVMGSLNKKAGEKKPAAVQEVPAPAPAPVAVAPAAPAVEDDTQLIAVITAAIAAVWQGQQSGFVVRRVRRVDTVSARARAAREEQIYTHL